MHTFLNAKKSFYLLLGSFYLEKKIKKGRTNVSNKIKMILSSKYYLGNMEMYFLIPG